MNDERGRASMDTLVELVVALLIVQPLMCCAFQAIVLVISVVLPWLLLVGIVAVCLGAGMTIRRHGHVEIEDEQPLRIPPVRRPAGIAERRHEQRDH